MIDKKDLQELKLWGSVLLLMALVSEVCFFVVYGSSFYVSFVQKQSGFEGIFLQLIFPFSGAAIFMYLAGWINLSARWKLVLVGLGVVLAIYLFAWGDGKYHYFSLVYILGIPAGIWLAIEAIWDVVRAKAEKRAVSEGSTAFLWVLLGSLALGVATHGTLQVTPVLLPLTHDVNLWMIDAAYGHFGRSVAMMADAMPAWVQSTTTFVYSLLAVMFFPQIAWLIREQKNRNLHGWRTMVVPFFIAVLCYAWLPATAPIAAFEGLYPKSMPPLEHMSSGLVSVPQAMRNAMPSMHLSGAILIFMVSAAFRHKWIALLAFVFTLGTAWATLALGEHYVIDLVVALPFSVAMGLWLIDPPLRRQAPAWQRVLHWLALATFVAWMLMLRLAPMWLQTHLWFVQLFSVWSAVVALQLLVWYVRMVWSEEHTREPSNGASTHISFSVLPAELAGKRWLVGIFFFSGLAGLVYEVVYAKALGVTFGGTALAANTVLMTYMGGMALGAWLGGWLAERSKRPLYLYAVFEAAIGLYAVITPFLFSGIQSLYVALALDTPPDAPALTALRMALGAIVLGVPTVLMGATLPLVFQCLRSLGIPTGRAIAPLYGANVLGAAVGALLGGYAILPAAGRDGGTLLAAVISLLVALYVIDKIKRQPGLFEAGSDRAVTALTAMPVPPPTRQGVGALTILTVGGVVTLALEVVFMHLLAVVAGNSVYAFGLMLATFLLGLGLGAMVGERLMLRYERAVLVLWAQCGIAVSILLTSFVWDGLADYMGSFAYVQQWLPLSFSARELVRAMVCAMAMLPPAFFIGMSYPAAMGLAADWLAARRFGGQAARGVGLASAANTLGNIAGVLLAGFWWLPQYGSRNVLLGLAVVVVVLAAFMAWATSEGRVVRRTAPVGFVAAALALFPAHWNFTALSQGGNVYFYPQEWGEVIDHAESVEGGLTTVAQMQIQGKPHLTLLTNGKFQGNNAEGGEMVAQESFALIPLLHTTERGRALAIGYGTGMTARVLQDQGFEKLDVVELSRDIVDMADKYFSNINAGISKHPSVSMYYTDGRNYLLTQSQNYDLISLEISSIWFAGAANLYNKEFYELAAKRLTSQGVLQQWVQLHHMRPLDFVYIMGSVRSVFRNVWLYVSGGQGIIVASNSDIATSGQPAALQKLLNSHTISSLKMADLPGRLVAGPAQIDAMLQRYDRSMSMFVSTDKNLYLEYATPKGNAVMFDTTPVLIQMLTQKP